MKASDFREHCKQVAHWVNWEDTRDQFMCGDPDADVKGIGVTWLATNARLRKAAELGLNFVIAHEGAFYPTYAETAVGERHHEEKRRLIEEFGLTLMRCHDTWDRMPEVGIPDAWAEWLGFPSDPRPVESFYRICRVDGRSVEELAREILDKVRPLGQQYVGYMGDPEAAVRRMAIGTGAITRLATMLELGADVLLATDDGVSTTAAGLLAHDMAAPTLIVNHACAELPGMMAMVGYIEERFPGVPVRYLAGRFPWPVVV